MRTLIDSLWVPVGTLEAYSPGNSPFLGLEKVGFLWLLSLSLDSFPPSPIQGSEYTQMEIVIKINSQQGRASAFDFIITIFSSGWREMKVELFL